MSDPSHAHFVDQRRFGDATITLIGEGFAPAPILRGLSVPEETWRRAVPEANARGEVILAVQVAHIAIGDASILVDSGLGEPLPGAPWTEPHVHRTPGVRAGLAAIGVQLEDVTHVLLTHAHPDHVGGLSADEHPRFPNARVLTGRADWEGNPGRSQSTSPPARHLGALERAGLLDLVDEAREVVPGVAMLAAPGESPGHMVVRVRSGGETFFFLGDLVHHPCQVAHPDWVLEGRDPEASLASRAELFGEAASTGATLAFTHGLFPAWGKVVAEGDSHRWVAG
jgi:glyoxylase-like metal-dependent hydrolase (beta-lactamase superfamily II)